MPEPSRTPGADSDRPAPSGEPDPDESQATTRRGLVENEIYETAATLFAERGFAGTSLKDIADAMGITRSALYYYVESKDDLLARLVTEITEGPATQLAQIAQGGADPVTRLREMVHLVAARRATDAVRFRLLVRSESELPDDLSAAHEEARRDVLKSVAVVIDEGIRTGQFRPVDARVAALAVLGMANWVAWWFDPEGRMDHEAIADQLSEMAITSLLRAEARTAAGDGPLAAVAMLREDLDHLERMLSDS